MAEFLNIVGNSKGPTCKGTKVLMPDGSEVPGVYKIELVAKPDSVWAATIHCHANVEEITALAEVVQTPTVPSNEWVELAVQVSNGNFNQADVIALARRLLSGEGQ